MEAQSLSLRTGDPDTAQQRPRCALDTTRTYYDPKNWKTVEPGSNEACVSIVLCLCCVCACSV
jgi:hypothetical protein